MSILNNQLKQSTLGLKGATPGVRAGAKPTSQLHAYGNFNAEAEAFQDASVFPREIKDLTNVNYRVRGEASQLDLDGVTPSKYSDDLPK